jgi:hypothetical protein
VAFVLSTGCQCANVVEGAVFQCEDAGCPFGMTCSAEGYCTGGNGGGGGNGNALVFTPTDDASLEALNPDTNYGTTDVLRADLSDLENFLLRFAVSGVRGRAVASATLRLHCVNSSQVGGTVHPSMSSWSEATVTWNTAPALDSKVLATLSAVALDQSVDVPLTGAVMGDGTYAFRVDSSSDDGADYSSKEGSNPPQLILVLSP